METPASGERRFSIYDAFIGEGRAELREKLRHHMEREPLRNSDLPMIALTRTG